ncbi:hypothetical protein [Clostridium arbusti]|nr:hypothetical protein [Clostridium arbusti]
MKNLFNSFVKNFFDGLVIVAPLSDFNIIKLNPSYLNESIVEEEVKKTA